ncbi:MAG: GldG family protein [Verrucomicrobiae bacterium]|nr:GldG family protein [Verrucomicrobiae bacterium]
MSEAKASSKSSGAKNDHHGKLGRVPTAIIGVVVVFVIAVLVNYIAGAIGGRADLTENNIYTLSDGTRSILKRVDTPVEIRYYVNDNSDFMTPAELAYSTRIEELLNQYQKVAGDKVTVKKLNPEPSTDAEDSAILDGLQQGVSQMTGAQIYCGVAVSCVDETEVLPFLPARPEPLLEYDLSRAIARVHDGAGSTIRIMTTMQIGGGFSGNPMGGGGPTPAWFFVDELRKDFTVEFLPATAEEIPADTETLIVLHPYDVAEETQFAIDQYLLKGGKVIVAVDPSFFYARAMGSGGNPMQAAQGPAPNSDLKKLFEAWGVDYDETKVVADLKHSTEIMRQGYFVPTFITLNHESMPADDPIVNTVTNAQFLTPGGFTITPPEGVTKTDLVVTSTETQLVGSFEADPTQEDAIKRLRENFEPSGTSYSIISRLSGNFKTAFPDGNPAAAAGAEEKDTEGDGDGEDKAEAEAATAPAETKAGDEKAAEEPKKDDSLKASEKEGVVLLISDVDFLYDAVCVRLNTIPGLNIRIPEPLNGNLSLIQNAIDQLSGDPALINIRSRGSSRRPFTKLQEWLADAEGRFRGEVSQFESKAKDAEARINEILSKTPGNAQDALMSPEVQSELENLRKEQVEMNKKVRELNKEMKRDFDLAQLLIKLLTTGLMPLAVILVGIFVAVSRRMKTAAH